MFNLLVESFAPFDGTKVERVTQPVISENWIIGIVLAFLVIIAEIVVLLVNKRKLKRQKEESVKLNSFLPYSFLAFFSLKGVMATLVIELLTIYILFKINLSVYKKLKKEFTKEDGE